MQSIAVWLLIALVAGVIAFLLYRKDKIKGSAFAAIPLLSFYIPFVLTITIIERVVTVKPQYQLVLFWTYEAIREGHADLRAEIFWNVVLFFPIGILVSMLLSKKTRWLCILIGALLSAGIELTQLFLHRGLFEFDDIVHNTLGTVIGLLLFLIANAIVSAVENK